MPEAAAYAKLNLCLAVAAPEPTLQADGTANRRGGWHRISSWFACIDLADRITLERTDSHGEIDTQIAFASRPDGTPPGVVDWPLDKDLGVRALRALLARAAPARATGFRLRIDKHIPTGAGLGGGSSDAATTLRLANHLLGSPLSTAELRAIGATLGSDVPFFIDDAATGQPPRPALVEGFGDRIERASAPSLDAVLVLPPVACPTPLVYRAFDAWRAEHPAHRFRDTDARALATRGHAPSHAQTLNHALFNDLAEPAFRVAPALRELHAACARMCPPFHVTGSGSTLFTLLPADAAAATAAALRTALPRDTRVLTASLLP